MKIHAEVARRITGSIGLRLTTLVEASELNHLLSKVLQLAFSEI